MNSYKAVRIITTKKGYKFLEQESKHNEDLQELFKDIDINKKFADLQLLGWDSLGENDVEELQESLEKLKEKDITYKFMSLGEDLVDIQSESYTSKKDEQKFIPSPYIIHEFDDEYMERMLLAYQVSFNTRQKFEEMEEE